MEYLGSNNPYAKPYATARSNVRRRSGSGSAADPNGPSDVGDDGYANGYANGLGSKRRKANSTDSADELAMAGAGAGSKAVGQMAVGSAKPERRDLRRGGGDGDGSDICARCDAWASDHEWFDGWVGTTYDGFCEPCFRYETNNTGDESDEAEEEDQGGGS